MDFFTFDSTENTLQIDDHHILLVKEFANLWDISRNKCEADKTGKKRLRAFREFTFLFLMLDFKSPYFKYTEGDKYEAAIEDSGLTKEELEDPLFIKAYEKYDYIIANSQLREYWAGVYTLLSTFERYNVSPHQPHSSFANAVVTVSVSGAFLKKCMDNPEKAAYLEENFGEK